MRNATFYDPSWEDSQSQAMPYGHGGPAATSGTNAGFIRDSRVCSGLRDDEETWAGEDEHVVPLPSISQAQAALTMTPANSVRCNTSRQTTAAECSRSPVLSAGSRHAGITVRSLLLDASPECAPAYSHARTTSAASTQQSLVPSANSNRPRVSPAEEHDVDVSSPPNRAGGRKAGVDKTGSDAINVIILRVILQENKMLRGFLGWGSKMGYKCMNQTGALSTLMLALGKHSNATVRALKESAVLRRVKNAVRSAKSMADTHDREKLSKLKFNGNEKTAEHGDDLDSYDKCVLEMAIEHEKLCSYQKEKAQLDKQQELDRSARLLAVSKVAARAHAEENHKRKRKQRLGNADRKRLERELQEAEGDLELVEEELQDDEQMDEDARGAVAVEEVRERAKKAKSLVDKLRKQLQDHMSSDDGSGEESNHRVFSTQQTQPDGDDSQVTRETREDAEVLATELERPRKQLTETAEKPRRTSTMDSLKVTRQRVSTSTVLSEGQHSQDQILKFMQEQTTGESEFRKSFLQLESQKHSAEQEHRRQKLLMEHMSPQSKKTFVNEQIQRQQELDLLNMLTPNSKKAAILERLKTKHT